MLQASNNMQPFIIQIDFSKGFNEKSTVAYDFLASINSFKTSSIMELLLDSRHSRIFDIGEQLYTTSFITLMGLGSWHRRWSHIKM